jgi:hypothetical protein
MPFVLGVTLPIKIKKTKQPDTRNVSFSSRLQYPVSWAELWSTSHALRRQSRRAWAATRRAPPVTSPGRDDVRGPVPTDRSPPQEPRDTSPWPLVSLTRWGPLYVGGVMKTGKKRIRDCLPVCCLPPLKTTQTTPRAAKRRRAPLPHSPPARRPNPNPPPSRSRSSFAACRRHWAPRPSSTDPSAVWSPSLLTVHCRCPVKRTRNPLGRGGLVSSSFASQWSPVLPFFCSCSSKYQPVHKRDICVHSR